MADNYFDPTEGVPVAQDTTSADASKGGVRKAWDAWTSKPENNAALLQFGIAMMQPRPQGQSSFGQFGNAIGSAGEASTANLAVQEAEKNQEAKRLEQESTANYRDTMGKAALTNADAYGRQVDRMNPSADKSAATSLLASQKSFNTWLKEKSDLTGLTSDPIFGAFKRKYGISSKDELVQKMIENPQFKREAFQLFRQADIGGDSSPIPEADPAAPAAPVQPPNAGVGAAPPVPGARFYNGHWYTRGPNGEMVPVPGF